MKILHHGYAYPNYCKCNQCGCEFIYENSETIHVLDAIQSFVWTEIQCPECEMNNTIYNYNGKINKVRKYYWHNKYKEIDFDENTMERR